MQQSLSVSVIPKDEPTTESHSPYQRLTKMSQNGHFIEVDEDELRHLLVIAGLEKEKLLALGKKSLAAAKIISQEPKSRDLCGAELIDLGLAHEEMADILLSDEALRRIVLNAADKRLRLMQLAKKSIIACQRILMEKVLFSQLPDEFIEELTYFFLEKHRTQRNLEKLPHSELQSLAHIFANSQNRVAVRSCYYQAALTGDADSMGRLLEHFSPNNSTCQFSIARIYDDRRNGLCDQERAIQMLRDASIRGSLEAMLYLLNKLITKNISSVRQAQHFNSKEDIDCRSIIQGLSALTEIYENEIVTFLLILAGLDMLRICDPEIKRDALTVLNMYAQRIQQSLSPELNEKYSKLYKLVADFIRLPAHYLATRLRYFSQLYETYAQYDDLIFTARLERMQQFETEDLPYLCMRSADAQRELEEVATQDLLVFQLITQLRDHDNILAEKERHCLALSQHESVELYKLRRDALRLLVNDLSKAHREYYERDFSDSIIIRDDKRIKLTLIRILAQHLERDNTPLVAHINLFTREISEDNSQFEARARSAYPQSIQRAENIDPFTMEIIKITFRLFHRLHTFFRQRSPLENMIHLKNRIPNDTVEFIFKEFLLKLDRAIPVAIAVDPKDKKRKDFIMEMADIYSTNSSDEGSAGPSGP